MPRMQPGDARFPDESKLLRPDYLLHSDANQSQGREHVRASGRKRAIPFLPFGVCSWSSRRAGAGRFQCSDPSSNSYVSPRDSYTVQDLAIFVDDTVDASASHPTRKPGATCMDVVTHGTAIIDSATQCEFPPGDVGQSINVGSTTTTILSYQSSTEVTLNTTVGSATGVTAYISAMGLPVTPTSAIADSPTTIRLGLIPSSRQSPFSAMCLFTQRLPLEITLVAFSFKPTPAQRGRAGRMCRSFLRPMDSHLCQYPQRLHRIRFGRESLTSISLTRSGIAAPYPWLVYNGELGEIRDMQIYTTGGTGPQFINAYGVAFTTSSWKIDIPELEGFGNCLAAPIGFRLAGENNHIKNLSLGTCANAVIQWDANGSQADNILIGTQPGQVFNLSGSLNTFLTQPYGGNNLSSMTKNITGNGNTFLTGDQWNFNIKQPARMQYAVPQYQAFGTAPFGTPELSRGAISLNRTHDFIDKGASDLFLSIWKTCGYGRRKHTTRLAAGQALQRWLPMQHRRRAAVSLSTRRLRRISMSRQATAQPFTSAPRFRQGSCAFTSKPRPTAPRT